MAPRPGALEQVLWAERLSGGGRRLVPLQTAEPRSLADEDRRGRKENEEEDDWEEGEGDEEWEDIEALLDSAPFALRMHVLRLREENVELQEENAVLRERGDAVEREMIRCRRENLEMHRRGDRRQEELNGILVRQAVEAEELKVRNARLRANSAAAFRVANRAAVELHKRRAGEWHPPFRPASPRPGDLLPGGGPRPPATPRGGHPASARKITPEEEGLLWLSKDRKDMTAEQSQAFGLLTLLEQHLLESNMRLRVCIGGGRTMDAREFFDVFRRLPAPGDGDGTLLEVAGVRSREELWRLLCLAVVPSKSKEDGRERISASAVDKACARAVMHLDPSLPSKPRRRATVV